MGDCCASSTLRLRGWNVREEARIDLAARENSDTLDATALVAFASPAARARLRSVRVHASIEETLRAFGDALGLVAPTLTWHLAGTERRFSSRWTGQSAAL